MARKAAAYAELAFNPVQEYLDRDCGRRQASLPADLEQDRNDCTWTPKDPTCTTQC